MLRAMLRDLLAHKARVGMTLVAVALGVAVVVASFGVAEMVTLALAGDGATRTDVGVSVEGPPSPGDAEGPPSPGDAEGTIGPPDMDRLVALPGVTGAVGVLRGRAGLVGDGGKVVPGDLGTAGTGWDASGRFRLLAGRPPARPGEVALADTTGRPVGGRARVLLAGGRIDAAVVVGVFAYRPLGGEDAAPAVAYDPVTAAKVLGDRFARVELATHSPGTVKRLAVSYGYRASTGAELAARARRAAEDDAQDLRETLLPFGAVALLVGTFVIANTFTMLLTQRTRQLALLRAVGARRRQVRWTVLAEATVLGLVGGTLGVLLGLGLAPLLIAVLRPGDEVAFAVSATGVLSGYAVAVLVTVLAAYGSARRAAAISPMAALRTDAVAPEAARRTRSPLGLAALVTGAAGVAATADPDGGTLSRVVALASAAVSAVGVVLLAPVIVGVLLRPLDRLAARHGGPALRLGVRNAARDPRRTAATASALMIGLALVCAFATVSESFAGLIGSTVRATVPTTTTVLRPAAGGGARLAPADLATVRATPGVTTAAASRDLLAELRYAGGTAKRIISAIEPAAMGTVLRPDVVAGSADLRRGVLVARNQAAMLGLGLGDRVTLVIDTETSVDVVVGGLYEASEFSASVYFDAALAPARMDGEITTIYATGADPGGVRRALDDAFRARPDITLTGRDGLVADAVRAQELGFLVMYAMFGIAVVVALFGVVNTLALSVMERTREIGVVRAIGASRGLIRRSIRLESLVIALCGALLGIVVGVTAGAVMQHAMLGQELLGFAVPYGVVGQAFAGMIVIGVLAAAWPARRAARTDPLSAIATG
ncbi:ABC transporter permease [Nonomuraea aurantiaca]|uniref:ABC transporter permease n=1 Tax=Nonomuraea aurantiaca TaxID=2878562 RepID=UPI001CDA128F|nr:ABC transporter permease [Nonomuraea aurantiaca]MCA2225965.1 ABC transporter permease [Nonomuraea aurantiaca]